jgi:hypothetical protein
VGRRVDPPDRARLTAASGLEDGHELALADRLAFIDLDFGDSTGISIFIDSRIMISPSTSTLSPGLS